MPNWIEGTLKLRGKGENLAKFFKEGLEPSTGLGVTDKEYIELEETDYDYFAARVWNEPHIAGTHRAFIGDCWESWGKGITTVAMPIRQAWAFRAEEWAEISKTYGIDVRLYGFEQGMEFCQEIEVIQGKVTKDNEIKYDDWDWECPMPRVGG